MAELVIKQNDEVLRDGRRYKCLWADNYNALMEPMSTESFSKSHRQIWNQESSIDQVILVVRDGIKIPTIPEYPSTLKLKLVWDVEGNLRCNMGMLSWHAFPVGRKAKLEGLSGPWYQLHGYVGTDPEVAICPMYGYADSETPISPAWTPATTHAYWKIVKETE